MISTTYLLTVALHAAVLSVLASAMLLVVRQARYRAVIAICGLLAVGILPWITALRPAPAPAVVSREIIPMPAPTALPVWTVVTLPAEMPATVASVSQPAAPAGFALPDPWELAIALWAAGTAAGLLLLGIAWLRQRNWRKSLEAIDDVSWAKLQATGSTLPDRNAFLLTSSTASPCVAGFRHPRVVLPRFLIADDSVTALGWAVRHELSHLRAGDSRWMLVLSLVRCLHGWNPFVHHLVSRWADAREQLCDLAAAEIPASRNSYGHFLVTMAGRIHRRQPLTVAMARRAPARRLRSRIVSLLDAEPGAEKPVGKRFVGLSLVGFVAVGVLVSVLNIRAEEAEVGRDLAVQIPAQEKQPESHSEERPANITDSVAPTPAASIEKTKFIQIKISTKLVATIGKSPVLDGAILDVAGLSKAMTQMSLVKGNVLITAPSISARPGQKATIEIIHEVLGSLDQISARKPGTPTAKVGIIFDSTAILKDELAELDSSVSYRFIPGVYQPTSDPSFSRRPPVRANPDDIKVLERKISARLESGMTVVADIGETEPGTFLQMFVTLQAIDVKGRATVAFTDDTVLWEESGPDASLSRSFTRPEFFQADPRPDGPLPKPEVVGKLRLSGDYVEFPRREGGLIPHDPLVRLVPTTSEISQTIINQSGAKVRQLKTMEVSLNKITTPWPEFPGLKITAMASNDFKRITVSSLPVGYGDDLEGLANMWRDQPNGSVMNFSLKSQDPKMERRLLIRIEAVK